MGVEWETTTLNFYFRYQFILITYFYRILAIGWNRHVTEFSDTNENELGKGKLWDTCHSEDVLAAAAREPDTLATSSYSGELVFWKLETGQPYRRYDVENPTIRLKVNILIMVFEILFKKLKWI